MQVQFLKDDATPFGIQVKGLNTKFQVVKEQISQQIDTDYFKIIKIINNSDNNNNLQLLEKINLNNSIGQYMDPESTYSFKIIKQIPLWIYYGKDKMYKMFNFEDTIDNVSKYAFGIQLNQEVQMNLVSNDQKKLDLQENYHKIQLYQFQKQQLPLHLYVKSITSNHQLYFQHKNKKQKKKQQIQKQEQKVKIQQNLLHLSVEIEKSVDKEKNQRSQGIISFDAIIKDLESQCKILQQARLNFIQQSKNFQQMLDQYHKQINEAQQIEGNELMERKYQKMKSNTQEYDQQLNMENLLNQLQTVFQKTTQEVEQIVINLNQQSQKENFIALSQFNLRKILENEIPDQKINNLSSQQLDFEDLKKRLEEFQTFFKTKNLNQQENFEELNQSSTQNHESSQQINNSQGNQINQSESIQDSVIFTQVSENNDRQFQT